MFNEEEKEEESISKDEMPQLKKNKKVIILKPRQIGISTVLRAYALWRTYQTKDPLKFGVISFHERSAKHLRKMDSTMHNSLPNILRKNLSVDNSTTLEFGDTGASVLNCPYFIEYCTILYSKSFVKIRI